MLSINEIIRTKSFKDARLLTDVDLTTPVIGSVTVGEVPDIAQWLTGGEMVLSTLFSAREAGDEKFETVRNIINSPAGALVVKLGRFVERLPDDIVSLAKEKRFPIISLPPEVRWTNVIMDISRLLGQRELAKLTWLEEVRQQFGKIATGDGDLSAIAKMLSGLIGCGVVIEDLVGGVVARSDGANEDVTKSRLMFELDDGRDLCGYLAVYADEAGDAGGFDESQLLAVEKAVEAANIEMSKVRASIDAEMRLMGNLFSLLNSGNLTGEQGSGRRNARTQRALPARKRNRCLI
ncbi:MAG: PucR family transcriptional regulator ligand-binding domain-containing protein [Candidatus Aquicultor sp.]